MLQAEDSAGAKVRRLEAAWYRRSLSSWAVLKIEDIHSRRT